MAISSPSSAMLGLCTRFLYSNNSAISSVLNQYQDMSRMNLDLIESFVGLCCIVAETPESSDTFSVWETGIGQFSDRITADIDTSLLIFGCCLCKGQGIKHQSWWGSPLLESDQLESEQTGIYCQALHHVLFYSIILWSSLPFRSTYARVGSRTEDGPR